MAAPGVCAQVEDAHLAGSSTGTQRAGLVAFSDDGDPSCSICLNTACDGQFKTAWVHLSCRHTFHICCLGASIKARCREVQENIKAEVERRVDGMQLDAEARRSILGSSAQFTDMQIRGQIRQCPKCHYGPVLNSNCDDLQAHDAERGTGPERTTNRCPHCDFFSCSWSDWEIWTLGDFSKILKCPNCRCDFSIADDALAQMERAKSELKQLLQDMHAKHCHDCFLGVCLYAALHLMECQELGAPTSLPTSFDQLIFDRQPGGSASAVLHADMLQMIGQCLDGNLVLKRESQELVRVPVPSESECYAAKTLFDIVHDVEQLVLKSRKSRIAWEQQELGLSMCLEEEVRECSRSIAMGNVEIATAPNDNIRAALAVLADLPKSRDSEESLLQVAQTLKDQLPCRYLPSVVANTVVVPSVEWKRSIQRDAAVSDVLSSARRGLASCGSPRSSSHPGYAALVDLERCMEILLDPALSLRSDHGTNQERSLSAAFRGLQEAVLEFARGGSQRIVDGSSVGFEDWNRVTVTSVNVDGTLNLQMPGQGSGSAVPAGSVSLQHGSSSKAALVLVLKLKDLAQQMACNFSDRPSPVTSVRLAQELISDVTRSCRGVRQVLSCVSEFMGEMGLGSFSRRRECHLRRMMQHDTFHDWMRDRDLHEMMHDIMARPELYEVLSQDLVEDDQGHSLMETTATEAMRNTDGCSIGEFLQVLLRKVLNLAGSEVGTAEVTHLEPATIFNPHEAVVVAGVLASTVPESVATNQVERNSISVGATSDARN